MTTTSTSDLERPAPEPSAVRVRRSHAKRSTGRTVALAAGATAGVVGLVILLYACSVHAIPGDSDGATVILEGQAYTHGNLLLHGWSLSLDSFWAVDAIVYAVLVAVAGVRAGLLYLGPAVIATAVIVVGICMAREGRRGSAALAGGATVIALLALPTHAMAYFFLRGPLHIGTALWALIAFSALRRARFGLGWAVAVLFLAAGMLGDLQMVAYGVIPMLLAGLVAFLRQRAWRAGIAQVSAAVAAPVVAEVVKKIRTALGGFSIGAANPIAGRHELLTNVKHVLTYGSEFFGIRDLFGTGGLPAWLQEVHAVGAVVVAACFVAALVLLVRGVIQGRRLGTGGGAPAAGSNAAGPVSSRATTGALELWRLDDMLLIATFGPAGAFVVLAVTTDPQYTRYLTASVIFASILAARMVARAWPKLGGGLLARGATAAGLAVALLFAAGVGYGLAQPKPVQTAGELASWLESHGLHNGVGDYWTANLETVESQGKVTIRPVVAGVSGVGGHLRRYTKQSAAAWYAGQKFQFFEWDTHLPWGNDDTVTATQTWGKPLHVYKVGPYWVLVWPRPLIVNPNPPDGGKTAS